MEEVLLSYLPVIVSTLATAVMGLITKSLSNKIASSCKNIQNKNYEIVKNIQPAILEQKEEIEELQKAIKSLEIQQDTLTKQLVDQIGSNVVNIEKTLEQTKEIEKIINEFKTIKKQNRDLLRKKESSNGKE